MEDSMHINCRMTMNKMLHKYSSLNKGCKRLSNDNTRDTILVQDIMMKDKFLKTS